MALLPSELKASIAGLLSFPVTPFTRDGAPDIPRYREHIQYMLSHGPGALFVCGGTGEFFSLSLTEYRELIKAAVAEAKGRVPIVAGVGYGTALAREFAAAAEEAGADGVMVMPPYLLVAEQEGLKAHYRAVAAAVKIGLVLYQRDNAVFHPQTVAELAEVPNIVGFKDGYGDVERMLRIRLAAGEKLVYINGMPTAELSAPAYLGIGVRDYSSAVFNFVPEISRAFYRALTSGETAKMEALLHGFYVPFARLRDQVRGYAVSLIKAGVSLRHKPVGGARPPLVDPTESHCRELQAIIARGLALVDSQP